MASPLQRRSAKGYYVWWGTLRLLFVMEPSWPHVAFLLA